MKKISFILALLMALSLVLGGCAPEKPSVEYTLRVTTEWDQGFDSVGIRIYADEGLTDLVWAQDTTSEGIAAFTAPEGNTYYATVENVPAGFAVKEHYVIEGSSSEIVLKAELLDEDSIKDTKFGLGSVFFDFSVTDAKGNTHTLSQLLKTKKAVVLNFWYINCAPCRMEFPYLEKAYEKYKDEIEVIAINPVDGTDEKLLAFAKDNGLSFPVACGDKEWEAALALASYPTTIVIDRNGVISMKHNGYIVEEGKFESVFEYFTSEDYTHTTVRNLTDIKE